MVAEEGTARILREFGMDRYTLPFKIDNRQEPTIWNRELCSVLYDLNGRGV